MAQPFGTIVSTHAGDRLFPKFERLNVYRHDNSYEATLDYISKILVLFIGQIFVNRVHIDPAP